MIQEHRIVIIGSLREFENLVIEAKKRGYYTIVCDGYKDGPAKKLADKAYNIDIRNVDAIAEMCISEKADGIIGSFSDAIFEQITKIANRAGLRWYVTPDKIKYYRDKYETKKALSKIEGTKSLFPKNAVLKADDFTEDEIAGFTFPLVAKPINGYGSKGIAVVQNINELRDRFDSIVEWNYDQSTNIIVEEYCNGEEYNMMCFVSNGVVYPLSVADREKNPQVGNSIPLLNRLVYPSVNIDKVLTEAIDVLQCFVNYTGQKEGPLSMQFFYDNGVKVCEIAGRLFGYEHELVTYCSGLSIEDLLLDYVYCPERVHEALTNHSPFFKKYVVGLYFVGKQGERIYDQTEARRLSTLDCVLDSQLFYQDGEIIDNFGKNPYLVRYFVESDSKKSADELSQFFFDTTKVFNDKGENIVCPFIMEKRR